MMPAMLVAVIMTMIVTVVVAVGVIMVVVVVVAVGMAVMIIVDGLDARDDGDSAGGLRVEHLAEEQHHRRASQREQRNEPNQVEEVHSLTT